MAKVFISFLGTGNYSECEYVAGEQRVTTRFVQEALVKMYCGDFQAADRLCILLTGKAREVNWEPPEGRHGLQGMLESLHLAAEIQAVDIPEGKSEEEIWAIFNTLFEVLRTRDEVLFDITHGFRSLPMLGFATLNYAQYLKEITVRGIYYGAYEAKDDQNRAPIFDLTEFYTLLRWASAADTFTHYGMSGKLNALVQETARFHHGTAGTAKAITQVMESLSTLRGADIVQGDIFHSCVTKIETLEKQGNYQSAFRPIFAKVKEKLEPFGQNKVENFLIAVERYLEYHMMPQALTMMQEGLVTFLMQGRGIDYQNKKCRESLSRFLTGINRRKRETAGERRGTEDPPKALLQEWGLSEEDPFLVKAADLYGRIGDQRNDVNHGGFNHNATPSHRIEVNVRRLFEDLQSLCGQRG